MLIDPVALCPPLLQRPASVRSMWFMWFQLSRTYIQVLPSPESFWGGPINSICQLVIVLMANISSQKGCRTKQGSVPMLGAVTWRRGVLGLPVLDRATASRDTFPDIRWTLGLLKCRSSEYYWYHSWDTRTIWYGQKHGHDVWGQPTLVLAPFGRGHGTMYCFSSSRL